jgi:predicted dehydrogenase
MLTATQPRFVVTSVPWDINPVAIRELVSKGMPVLCETPPAPDAKAMADLCKFVRSKKGRVQVAEQVHLRPHHQAQIKVATSGRLGKVHEGVVSASHGYHGISVMRRLLGLTYENCIITGSQFTSPIIQGPGRAGPPTKEKTIQATRDFYFFNYGDKLGVIDFTGTQYFAWIRSEHVQVRGTRGELTNDQVRCLKDFRTPLQYPLTRIMEGQNGNLYALRLVGYQAAGEWIYRSSFTTQGMMDDEIAIADALIRMDTCARTGKEFYPLEEGCQDHYLWLLAQQACRTGKPVTSRTQPWAR